MVTTITATELDTSFGRTEATPAFTRKSNLIMTPAMNELRDGRTTFQITNLNAYTFIISHGAIVDYCKIITPGQANHLRPMSLEQLTLVSSHVEEVNNVIHQLFQTPCSPVDKRWYPTPKTCEDPTKLNPTERRAYHEIL